jgi:copper(I)-binding protein
MQTFRVHIPVFVLSGILFTACNGKAEAPLVASDVVISEPPPGRAMSAGYLTLRNNTNGVIRISGVDSPQFGFVEIHETRLEDGVAKMLLVPELLIPAKSSVSLQPGGKHLMLMRPIGTPENISLSFYDDETLLLSVQAPMTRRSN